MRTKIQSTVYMLSFHTFCLTLGVKGKFDEMKKELVSGRPLKIHLDF